MFKIIEPNIFNVDKVKYSLIDTSYIDNYKIEDEKSSSFLIIYLMLLIILLN